MKTIKKNWTSLIENYQIGEILTGTIIHHKHFGAFVDIGKCEILGLIRF